MARTPAPDTTNSGRGGSPAVTDTSNRRHGSEGNYTYVQTTPRETHAITPSGSVPRTGR